MWLCLTDKIIRKNIILKIIRIKALAIYLTRLIDSYYCCSCHGRRYCSDAAQCYKLRYNCSTNVYAYFSNRYSSIIRLSTIFRLNRAYLLQNVMLIIWRPDRALRSPSKSLYLTYRSSQRKISPHSAVSCLLFIPFANEVLKPIPFWPGCGLAFSR